MTGAPPELLLETKAYFCVKDNEERDKSLLNLGGTTRAFVPFGGGAFYILSRKIFIKGDHFYAVDRS